MALAHAKSNLSNIYDDLAHLKEKQQQYDSAIHYQRRALERFPNPQSAQKKHPTGAVGRVTIW